MNTDLVSIIMATYNSERFVKESIQSILNQTYSNFELIITDDFSKDSTRDILKTFRTKDHRIKLVFLNQNLGSAGSRNSSLKLAKGKFIAFCDSDDIWVENKLERQINFLKSNNYFFCYSSYVKFKDSIKNKKSYQYVESPKEVQRKDLLFRNPIGCSTVVFNKEILDITKLNFPNLRKRQDWGLWIKINNDIPTFHGINEPLVYYRLLKDSVSSNKFSLIKYNWLVYKRVLNFSWLKSSIFLFIFLIFYFNKLISKSR